MPGEPRDAREELERILAGAAEAALQSTDEEIVAETRSHGEDPTEAATQMRAAVEETLERHEAKERLRRARAEFEARPATLGERLRKIPESLKEQRRMLHDALFNRPAYAGPVTVQFRELKDRGLDNMPDEDVTSLLHQLAELGALDHLLEDDE